MKKHKQVGGIIDGKRWCSLCKKLERIIRNGN